MSTEHPVKLKSWQPEQTARAVIIALHSHGDYHAAFEHIGPWLSAQGYAVYSYDQPGFGAQPQAGHWPGNEALEQALVRHLRALRAHYQVPVFVLGESLGGAVAINVASSPDGCLIDGLVLAAPAVREGIRGRYAWNLAIGGAALLAPGWTLAVARDANDPRFHETSAQRLAQDPLVHREVRLSAYWGLIRLADRASDNLPHVRQPVMLLYGGKDTSVPAISIRRARRHLSEHTDLTYRFVPDGIHLLLQARDWQAHASDIAQWLQRTLDEQQSRQASNTEQRSLAYCPS